MHVHNHGRTFVNDYTREILSEVLPQWEELSISSPPPYEPTPKDDRNPFLFVRDRITPILRLALDLSILGCSFKVELRKPHTQASYADLVLRYSTDLIKLIWVVEDNPTLFEGISGWVVPLNPQGDVLGNHARLF